MKCQKTTIHLGSDHAGFDLKEAVGRYLRRADYDIRDHGAFSAEPSDYPDFIIPAAEAVAKSAGRAKGIVFGGSGNGECIAANKVKGVRAALVFDAYTAKKAREHNDANVICLGSRTPTGDPKLAVRLVKAWLSADFAAGRHARRLKKIAAYEKRRCRKL